MITQPITINEPYLAEKNIINQDVCTATLQTDIWTGCQNKLRYQVAQSEIELMKQRSRLEQRLEFEKHISEMKIYYDTYLKMMSCSVYRDSAGDIIYAIRDPDDKKIVSKVLLNVKGYKSRIYISYYPQIHTLLEISWGGDEGNRVYFDYTNEGVSPRDFLRTLKAKGVLLLVSGRTEIKAAQVLLSYSVSSADNVEIPYTYGWGKDKEGKWHFAKKTELVMREVKKNV